MPLVRATGFDLGTAANEQLSLSGTASIQTSIKRTGSHALRTNPTTTGTGYCTVSGHNTTYGSAGGASFGAVSGWLRFYFRIATAPSANSEGFAWATIGTNSVTSLRLNSSRNILIYDSTGTLIGTSSETLATGEWHLIEWFVSRGAAGTNTKLRINGVESLSVNGTFNSGSVTISSFSLGKYSNTNGQSVDFYYDDVIFTTDASSSPPGPGVVVKLAPNADGNYTAWVAGTGSGGYAEIDDFASNPTTHDSDTSYVKTSTNGDVESAQCQSLSDVGVTGVGTVNGVIAYAVMRDTGTACARRVGIRSGSTDAWLSPLDDANSYQSWAILRTTDPATSAAWTYDGVNAAEPMAGHSQAEARELRLTALVLVVSISNIATIHTGSGSADVAFGAAATGEIEGATVWTGSGSAALAFAATPTGRLLHTTRLYLQRTTTGVPVSPATGSGWGSTTNFRRAMFLRTKIIETGAQDGYTGTPGVTMLHRQFISDPLPAMTLRGTVRGSINTREGATTANFAYVPWGLRVFSGDGTTERAVLVAVGAHRAAFTEPGTATNWQYIRRYAIDYEITDYTCVAGDRLVFEIGVLDSSGVTPQLYLTWVARSNYPDAEYADTDYATGTPRNSWIEFHLETGLGFLQTGSGSASVALAAAAAGRTVYNGSASADVALAAAAVGELIAGGTVWTGSASESSTSSVSAAGGALMRLNAGSGSSTTDASGIGEIVEPDGTVWTGSGDVSSSTDASGTGKLNAAGSGAASSDTDETATGSAIFAGVGASASATPSTGNGGLITTNIGTSTSATAAVGNGGLVITNSGTSVSTTSTSGVGSANFLAVGSADSTTAANGNGGLVTTNSASSSTSTSTTGDGYLIARGSGSVSSASAVTGIGHTYILASGVATSGTSVSGAGSLKAAGSGASSSSSATAGNGGAILSIAGSTTSATSTVGNGGMVNGGTGSAPSDSASDATGSLIARGSSSVVQDTESSGSGYIIAGGIGSSTSPTSSTGAGGIIWQNILGLAASLTATVGLGFLLASGAAAETAVTDAEGIGSVKQKSIASITTGIKKQPQKQTFLKWRDRCIISSFQQDFYKRVVTPVRLFKANKDPDFDSLYLERENDFDTPGEWVEVKAYVRFDPQHIETKKEGIEQYRPVIVDFSIGALKKAGIEKPIFGDVIQITGELYRVTGFSNRDYVNHSGDFLTHSVIAAKIRPSSIHDPGLTLKSLEDYIPEDTVLGSRKDYLYYWDQQVNFFLKVFPKVAVYQRPEEVVVDLLYQEVVKENKLEWIRHDYPANLTLNPQAADLKKFGIELWRDCKLVVSIPLLKQYGYPLPTVNSIFATEKEFYKITDVFTTNYVTSAWIPLNVVLLGVKYRPSSLEPDEIPTIEQSRTLFFPEHDVQYASSAFAEFNERSFTYVQFIDRNRDSQDFDLLYLEDLEDWKTKGIQYQIPCYVRLEPNTKFLKKFGIDSERDIYISLSKSLADKYMPFERGETGNRMKYPGVGTVVIVEGEPYTITDFPPQHYFGNVYNEESRALGIVLFGKKLRSSTFDDRDKVYDAEAVPEPEKPPSGDDYL